MCDDFYDDFDDFDDEGPMDEEPFEDDPEPLDDPVESCSDSTGPGWEHIAFFGAMSETLNEERRIQRHLEKEDRKRDKTRTICRGGLRHCSMAAGGAVLSENFLKFLTI
ncbi:MAG: hypothetical protein K9L59_03770 [Desulfobacterales bacterium]|nr:hypothetical protein [Desulfobacterales bacterium]